MTWSGPRASEGVSGAAAQFHGRGSIARWVCLRVVGVAEVDGRRLAQTSATRISPKPRGRLRRRGLALEGTVRETGSQERGHAQVLEREETPRDGPRWRNRGTEESPLRGPGSETALGSRKQRTRRWKASRIENAAVSSRGLRGIRSRLSRPAPVRAKAPPGQRGSDRDVRGSVASIRRGEENAPGAEKVDGPAEARSGVVKHRAPARSMGRKPRDESGAHEAKVLVVRVRRSRSRSDASRVERYGEPQGEPGGRR